MNTNKSEDVIWTTEEEQKEESVKVPKTDNAKFQDKLELENQNKETFEEDLMQGTSEDTLDGVKPENIKDELLDVNGNPKVDPNKLDNHDKALRKVMRNMAYVKVMISNHKLPKSVLITWILKERKQRKKCHFT